MSETFDVETYHKLTLRNLQASDYEDVREIMNRVYPPDLGAWRKDQFNAMIDRFPEGQICVEDRGKVVSAALTMIIRFSKYGQNHTYQDIIGDGFFTNHDRNGDYLYGIDIFVHPDYREMRLGRRLYDARKELCERLNLRGILIGGRIPGYENYRHEMTPQQYVQAVRNKEIHDPVLTFQITNDFHILNLIRNYLPGDHESQAYGVLLTWNNIFHDPKPEKIRWGQKSYARLGVVQWEMRTYQSFDDFLQQVEFFVDTVAGYNSDLILFPELFNAPLMSEFNQENPAEAMRSLAGYTPDILEELTKLAVSYNINIVSGSLPEERDGKLFNVSFLCRRDGTWDSQYKLHITPDEFQYWGLQGGNELKVFDTDVGKIGILVCYDVEFPELPRLLADRGVRILLVPYLTDTKNGYLRVRRCAQARAIENECYVAITGSVGNLPKVENMDIQYSQSAVFTPSDFPFPHDAVAAEATPNTEMTLIVDLDLDLLKELREKGSVRNILSRRTDLYRLSWLKR
jgi:predicted amidohydrolase/ribosomal protein S18 acetylase RimI-like enzyme